LIADIVFADEEELNCWRVVLLGSIVGVVVGNSIIDEFKASIDREGFVG